MSKPEHKGEQKHDHKPEGKPEAKHDAKSAGDKTPAGGTKAPGKPSGPGRGKVHEALPGMCNAWGCKHKSSTFNFCAEHFDHFKFGLLKKTGEPVPDYEKKFEHFTAYVAKQRAHKVA